MATNVATAALGARIVLRSQWANKFHTRRVDVRCAEAVGHLLMRMLTAARDHNSEHE